MIKTVTVSIYLLTAFCSQLRANEVRLFELSFSLDDKAHTKFTYWITKDKVCGTEDIPGWAVHGGTSYHGDKALEKALRCTVLAEAITEPEQLPKKPSDIVMLKYIYKGKEKTKSFPVKGLPSEFCEIFSILGMSIIFPGSRFEFLDKSLQKQCLEVKREPPEWIRN